MSHMRHSGEVGGSSRTDATSPSDTDGGDTIMSSPGHPELATSETRH